MAQPAGKPHKRRGFDEGTHKFNVPSGGVSAHGRRAAKKKGETMPGTGGKFPIRNKSDLAKAKHDIGRTSEPREKVVKWIDERARELGGRPVGETKRAAKKHERKEHRRRK